jgi:hypothetical protein
MKSILFTSLVFCAVAYLAYSQSGDVKHWADNITQGRAADWVATVDGVKSDVVEGIDSGIERAGDHAKKYETSVITLKKEIKVLQAENARLLKELALRKEASPRSAGHEETITSVRSDAGVELSGTKRPATEKSGTRGATLSMAERSKSLLLLIEKMHLKSAGR